LLSKEELDSVMAEFNQNRGARAAQKRLAYEVTKIVHGQQAADDVARVTEVLFGKGELNEEDYEVIKNVMPATQIAAGAPLLEALVTLGLAGSNTEARRFVTEGAIKVNNDRANADKQSLTNDDFHAGIAVIRRGKNSVAVGSLQ
jgi:tyrosyl-tRNA synthetase